MSKYSSPQQIKSIGSVASTPTGSLSVSAPRHVDPAGSGSPAAAATAAATVRHTTAVFPSHSPSRNSIGVAPPAASNSNSPGPNHGMGEIYRPVADASSVVPSNTYVGAAQSTASQQSRQDVMASWLASPEAPVCATLPSSTATAAEPSPSRIRSPSAVAASSPNITSVSGGSSLPADRQPPIIAASEAALLNRLLSMKDADFAALQAKRDQEHAEWSELLRIAQDENRLLRRDFDVTKRELHSAQEREQRAVRDLDVANVEARHHQADAQRLEDTVKRQADNLKKLEDIAVTRAKEVSVANIGRSRAEKRAAAYESQLIESESQMAKLKEKVHALTNEVGRLQKEFHSSTSSLTQLLDDKKEHTNGLEEELKELQAALEAETSKRKSVEADLASLQRHEDEQALLLQQCNQAMASLDDENKILQDSNSALRNNSDRLGENVKVHLETIAELTAAVASANLEKQDLSGKLIVAEDNAHTLQGRLDDALRELNTQEENMEQMQSTMHEDRAQHSATLGEVQVAFVTARRQWDVERDKLQRRVADLEAAHEGLERALQDQQRHFETQLVIALATKETEMQEAASAERRDLQQSLQQEHEEDPRIVHYTRLQFTNHAMEHQVSLWESWAATLMDDLFVEEATARSALEEYSLYMLELFHISAIEIPRSFASWSVAIADDSVVAATAVVDGGGGGGGGASFSPQSTSGNSVASRRKPTTIPIFIRDDDYHGDGPAAASSTAVSEHWEDRQRRVKRVAELLLRSRLIRRRLRTLFGLSSWRLLVKEKLIPDDFGQLLCDLVEDFEWVHDAHTELARRTLSLRERQEWGISPLVPSDVVRLVD